MMLFRRSGALLIAGKPQATVRLVCALALVAIAGCTARNPETAEAPPEKLSAYELFVGNGSTQQPLPGVLPYDLNSALFSLFALGFGLLQRLSGSPTCVVPSAPPR